MLRAATLVILLNWSPTAMAKGAENEVFAPPANPSPDEVPHSSDAFVAACIKSVKGIKSIGKLGESSLTTYSTNFGPIWRVDFESLYKSVGLTNRLVCWHPDSKQLHIQVIVGQKLLPLPAN
jgi:hypothetical protein